MCVPLSKLSLSLHAQADWDWVHVRRCAFWQDERINSNADEMSLEKMPDNTGTWDHESQDFQGTKQAESKSAKVQLPTSLTRNSELSRIKKVLFSQFKGLSPIEDQVVSLGESRFLTLVPAMQALKKFGFDCSVVFDRNTASFPGFHFPLLLDMVRDSARNRLLNVLSFACIFSTVILILSSFVFVSPQPSVPAQVCPSFFLQYLRQPCILLSSGRICYVAKVTANPH